MNWALILLWCWNGCATTQVPMETKEVCEQAAAIAKGHSEGWNRNSLHFEAFCVTTTK